MATLSSESKRDLLLLNLRRSISDAQKIIHAADATKQLLALFRDHLNDPAHKAQPRSNIFKYSNTTSRTHESNPVLAVGDPSSETFDMTQNTSGSKHDLLLFNLRTSISAVERIQFDVNTTKDHFRDVLNDPSHKPRPQFNIFKQTGAIPYTGEPRNGLSDSDPCLKVFCRKYVFSLFCFIRTRIPMQFFMAVLRWDGIADRKHACRRTKSAD
jgi:hypothetical protein